MQHLLTYLLPLSLLATTTTLAQTTTPTTTTPTTSQLTIATAPNSSPTTSDSSSLPNLISQLPPCALPCFSSASNANACAPTDLSCLCAPSKSTSLTIAIGTCLSTSGLSGACASDKLGGLATLAGKICDAVNGGDASELASGSAAVSSALASASATGSGNAETTGGGKQNGGQGRGKVNRGVLVLIAAYVFVAF
ncbi:hypothetical protein QBC47DRAFT_53334 [Echria macrotheca]|uniref:CFEM domain-containing protein n=1 Tax=Echria macrotheca TaxID=438768 RepID=A0AAJ0BC45_9PEZI|nr:hypothetical protein QBC47DRAFT_53334 [Echria macrotheca]